MTPSPVDYPRFIDGALAGPAGVGPWGLIQGVVGSTLFAAAWSTEFQILLNTR
jgi:hypothetical protein